MRASMIRHKAGIKRFIYHMMIHIKSPTIPLNPEVGYTSREFHQYKRWELARMLRDVRQGNVTSNIHIHNAYCDGAFCLKSNGVVRVLPLAGDANLIVCRDCFRYEIAWRVERIKEGVQYNIPRWQDLKVYHPE